MRDYRITLSNIGTEANITKHFFVSTFLLVYGDIGYYVNITTDYFSHYNTIFREKPHDASTNLSDIRHREVLTNQFPQLRVTISSCRLVVYIIRKLERSPSIDRNIILKSLIIQIDIISIFGI